MAAVPRCPPDGRRGRGRGRRHFGRCEAAGRDGTAPHRSPALARHPLGTGTSPATSPRRCPASSRRAATSKVNSSCAWVPTTHTRTGTSLWRSSRSSAGGAMLTPSSWPAQRCRTGRPGSARPTLGCITAKRSSPRSFSCPTSHPPSATGSSATLIWCCTRLRRRVSGWSPTRQLAFGTPTLFTRFGPLQELAPDIPVAADDWSPDSLADAADSLLSDPAQARAQVESCLAAGTKYTWEATAERLADLYRHVMALTPR